MNELDIEIVQETVEKIILKGALTLKAFSSRLTEMDGTLAHKLNDIDYEESDTMVENLIVLTDNVGNFEDIKDTLGSWGKALKEMGVDKSDYQTLGSVYVDTLAYVFGPSFTPEVMNAWVKVYKTAMPYMIAGAGY